MSKIVQKSKWYKRFAWLPTYIYSTKKWVWLREYKERVLTRDVLPLIFIRERKM